MYILTRSRVRTDPNIYMILYMYMCGSVCVCIYSPVVGYELIPTLFDEITYVDIYI